MTTRSRRILSRGLAAFMLTCSSGCAGVIVLPEAMEPRQFRESFPEGRPAVWKAATTVAESAGWSILTREESSGVLSFVVPSLEAGPSVVVNLVIQDKSGGHGTLVWIFTHGGSRETGVRRADERILHLLHETVARI